MRVATRWQSVGPAHGGISDCDVPSSLRSCNPCKRSALSPSPVLAQHVASEIERAADKDAARARLRRRRGDGGTHGVIDLRAETHRAAGGGGILGAAAVD